MATKKMIIHTTHGIYFCETMHGHPVNVLEITGNGKALMFYGYVSDISKIASMEFHDNGMSTLNEESSSDEKMWVMRVFKQNMKQHVIIGTTAITEGNIIADVNLSFFLSHHITRTPSFIKIMSQLRDSEKVVDLYRMNH